jgi:ATP/maltotriose-dependent transcriptional regulator MalT
MTEGHMGRPVFVGRRVELDALQKAWATSCTDGAAGILVTGEAGTGKTSLVDQFLASLPAGHLVLRGACVPQDAGTLPYGPFVAAVRRLRRTSAAEELRALLGDDLVARMETAIPTSAADTEAAPADLARSRLFSAYLALLEAASARGPAVLVVEDLHWVDPPSLDLLRFLLSNLEAPGVFTILTQRPVDAVGPGAALADLSRSPWLVTMPLFGLDLDEVRQHLQVLLGTDPDAETVDSVLRRTDGVPLYTEALVGPDRTVLPGLPGSLRDLLLRPFNSLPAESRQVVKAASLAGPRISHQLLAAITSTSTAELVEDLRPALQAGVLVADEISYRFRHDLIGQAVRDHLLPGERVEVHRRLAEAFQAGASTDVEDEEAEVPVVHRAVRVARHWRRAHAHRQTLQAAIAAARTAATAGRPVEQLDMLELALRVWDRVPDAEALTDTTRALLLEEAAKASCLAARPERGAMLSAAALELLDPERDADRYAAMLLERASSKHLLLRSPAYEDFDTALRLPLKWVVRLELLGTLVRTAVDEGDLGRAREALDAMVETAADHSLPEAVRLEHALTRLRVDLASTPAHHLLDTAQECHRWARRLGHPELEAMAGLTLLQAVAWSGALATAVDLGLEALTRAGASGAQHLHGARLVFATAALLTATGSWSRAVDVLGRGMRSASSPHHLAHFHLLHAEIALRRGELDPTEQHLTSVRELLRDGQGNTQLRLHLARLAVEHGHLVGANAQVLASTEELTDADSVSRMRWPALAAAAGALAGEGARAGHARNSALARLAASAASLPVLDPADAVHHAVVEAELGRRAGAATVDGWTAIADRWAGLQRPYERAVALLRAAQCAASDNRRTAVDLLRTASTAAHDVDAGVLARQVAALARRLGADADRPDTTLSALDGGPAIHLTQRETEVLRLVACGMSNNEIAAELFISRKTASVHVSNILTKLQVSSRGAAAAFAHRHQLFDLS